jgi:hypothetical protein
MSNDCNFICSIHSRNYVTRTILSIGLRWIASSVSIREYSLTIWFDDTVKDANIESNQYSLIYTISIFSFPSFKSPYIPKVRNRLVLPLPLLTAIFLVYLLCLVDSTKKIIQEEDHKIVHRHHLKECA